MAAGMSGAELNKAKETLMDLHLQLSRALEIEDMRPLVEEFDKLDHYLKALQQEPQNPYVKAEIMARGEKMSTVLGAAFLRAQGLDCQWLDATTILQAEPHEEGDTRGVLASCCSYEYDPRLDQHLERGARRVYITQGFMAGDAKGRTVLLGRGGSDTSAAYMAAKLNAARLEIWTDVPGLFSANPRDVHDARQLRVVDFAEAELLASMGAKVLHPRCVKPAADADIPILVGCTNAPQIPGTLIRKHESNHDAAVVKAVTLRDEMNLLSVQPEENGEPDTAMLRDFVGLLSKHKLEPEDFSATTDGVRATLDAKLHPFSEDDHKEILSDLNETGSGQIHTGVSCLCLVGEDLTESPQLIGGALGNLEDGNVHFVSNRDDGKTISFLLDHDQPISLVQSLHQELISKNACDKVFGPDWQAVQRAIESAPEPKPLKKGEIHISVGVERLSVLDKVSA